METVQKISTRILVPAVTATIIFSLGLFFIAGSTLNRLAERNLIRIAQSKVSDINISEKRVAGEILAQASLFSRAEGVLKAYENKRVFFEAVTQGKLGYCLFWGEKP